MTRADRQRSQVYAAEGVVASMIDRRADFPVVQLFGSQIIVPDDRKFGDVASVQRYVEAVLGLDWVHRLAPERAAVPLRVRPRAGATKAEYHANTHTIALPTHRVGGRWAMRELVVLHEIAHHLSPGIEHGAPFVAMLVELVDGLVGPEAGFLLRSQLSAGAAGAAPPGTR
ncbi:MAG: hypothetical protein QOI15_1623 [Pseudonocardiales bacterium]|nr:hypothetical protein [Pseudonocardiales bacterium]